MDVTVRDAALAEAPSREAIERLEHKMRQMPQVEVPVEHTFGPGFYARTITIKEGTTLVGKVHKTEHIFMVVSGDITLVTEEGKKRVQGPYQVVCKPGTKRAGYAHTDTVCTNIHITAETDLTALEQQLIDNITESLGHTELPILEE